MNPPSEFSYLKPGAITHLHGQGSRLEMLNPKKETEDHARSWKQFFATPWKQEKSADLCRRSFEKYEAALRIKPDSHEALHSWGNALSDLARQEKSEDLYRQSFREI